MNNIFVLFANRLQQLENNKIYLVLFGTESLVSTPEPFGIYWSPVPVPDAVQKCTIAPCAQHGCTRHSRAARSYSFSQFSSQYINNNNRKKFYFFVCCFRLIITKSILSLELIYLVIDSGIVPSVYSSSIFVLSFFIILTYRSQLSSSTRSFVF